MTNTTHEIPRSGLGILFPGQGSQSVGMLAELAQSFPQVRATYEEASTALGYDLWRLVQDGPDSELDRTEHTQPAMLAAGVAVWRVWRAERGPLPMVMAGHSLGEYSALVCAGALDFAATVTLVADRGRYMQEAVSEGEGAMAAILGLADAEVVAACNTASEGEVVMAANFNAPGQVVVAGQRAAVLRAVEVAKAAGAKARMLPMSVPSHCSLMVGAAQRLRARLDTLAMACPQIPVINNVDVADPTDGVAIRDALVRQLSSPVRWVECVRAQKDRGVQTVVELGPGKVLAGLNKRIDKGLENRSVFDTASLHQALEALV